MHNYPMYTMTKSQWTTPTLKCLFVINLHWLCHNRNNQNRCCVSSWQDFVRVQHKLLQGPGRPESPEEHGKDDKSESAVEEERPNKDEGDGALPDSAPAVARSAMGLSRRGNGHSSIKSDEGHVREGCKTGRPWELRKEPCRSRGSRDVVFTTLHLLPRLEGESCRPSSSTLPRLLTGQQAHSRVSAVARKVRNNPNIIFSFIR